MYYRKDFTLFDYFLSSVSFSKKKKILQKRNNNIQQLKNLNYLNNTFVKCIIESNFLNDCILLCLFLQDLKNN